MRYMLLIYTNEIAFAKMSPEEMQRIRDAHWAVMDATAKRGILHGAEPLHPTSTATTVRVQDGNVLTTDGPFAETKEQLAGYYIIDCKDRDEAVAWAAQIPTSCGGGSGCVEVRLIHEIGKRPEASILEPSSAAAGH